MNKRCSIGVRKIHSQLGFRVAIIIVLIYSIFTHGSEQIFLGYETQQVEKKANEKKTTNLARDSNRLDIFSSYEKQ